MSTVQRPPHGTPATSVFPRFQEDIYRWGTSEIEGLSAEHLDFDSWHPLLQTMLLPHAQRLGTPIYGRCQ